MNTEDWKGINAKDSIINVRDSNFNFVSPEHTQANSPNNLQFTGSANFVGRSHELTLLRDRLQQVGMVAITAVSGMGGVGKTELALRYARQHKADYPGGICWLNARDSNLAAEIVQFAQIYMKLEVPQQDFRERALSLTEQVAWCWQHWQPAEGRVLIVLDDVTSLEGYRDVLPRADRFRVLMTTRSRNLDSNIEEISLDVLLPEEALEFLTKLVGTKVQKELEVAKQLCEWLGYLPLGLELVGRYIAKKPLNWTIAKMLQRVKEQQLKDEALNVEQQKLQKTLSTAQRGVLAAFELSWLELEHKTQNVAMLLSLFAPEIFIWEWVESTVGLLKWVASDADTANEQLYELYLIQWVEDTDGNYKIKIHPLIREFLKVKLALSEQADDLKHAFAKTMVAIPLSIDNSPTQKFINLIKDAIPHVTEVAQNLTDAVSDQNLTWVFIGLSRFYSRQGLYALAEPWLKQGLLVVQDRLGQEHPDVAQIYNSLGLVYENQGKYSEAEPLFLRALKLRQRHLGEEDSEIATISNNLAGLYEKQGKYSEAEPLLLRALELWQRLGEERPEITTIYNNLARNYKLLEKYSEARRLHLKALKLGQKQLGKEHPTIGLIYKDLAALYSSQRRYKKAELLHLKALELLQKLLGEEHPTIGEIYNNLALLYSDQGRYSEAEPLYKKALSLTQQLLGEEHPSVATCYNNLANLYIDQGRYTKAEPLYQKVLELRRQRLGEEHLDIALIYNDLARLYIGQGKYPEVESMYQKAFELRQRLLGEEHSDVAQSYNNLAVAYSYQERYSEAESMYQKALQLYQRVLKEENIRVANTYNSLASLYIRQEKYSEAEPLCKKALQLRQRLLGEEHPDVAASYHTLALLYSDQGRYSEAEPLFQKALQLYEQQLGVGHPETIIVRKNYANFLKNK